MARKYKTSYKTHRNVKRFHVSFDAQPTTQERATICEDCGGGIEEVMTVNRCFRCEGIRRRNQPDPRIARRDNILAIFEDEPVSKETAAELINELAEIDQALQFKPADVLQDQITVTIPGKGIYLTQKGLQKYYNQRTQK